MRREAIWRSQHDSPANLPNIAGTNEYRRVIMINAKQQNVCSKSVLACGLALACFSAPLLKATAASMESTDQNKDCLAAPDNCVDDKLHMRIGIPLWAPSLKSDITIGQLQAHGDKDFASFSSRGDFIAPLELELRKNRFYFNADGIYIKTGNNIETRGILGGPGSTAELTLKQFFGAFDVGYEIIKDPCFSLTAFGGARVTFLNPHLSITSPVGSASRSTERLYGDPIIGLYATYQFAGWIGVYVKGDAGGFGLFNDHLTWEAQPGIEWRPSRHTYIRTGWRWTSVDVVNRPNFNFNSTFGGPLLEFGGRF